MALKLGLARFAHRIERGIDTFRRGPAADNPIIDCYGGYTSNEQIILRGRVLAQARAISGENPQSRWRNFQDFLSLFYTDELANVGIEAPAFDQRTQTDEEGFFNLAVPLPEGGPPAVVMVQAAGASEVHHVPVFSGIDAEFGVISDIDDTILRTGAYSLIKNLWTSATGNVHQREVFQDAVALLQSFEEQGACFFYVSSSPWNLYDYLQSVFVRMSLPMGPFFLRDLGISSTQFITGTHGDHKTSAIETILAANPSITFTLVGDTGQHDPHIYADIVQRFPGRIGQVVLRRPNDEELEQAVLDDIQMIKAAGVPALVDFDYRKLLEEAAQ